MNAKNALYIANFNFITLGSRLCVFLQMKKLKLRLNLEKAFYKLPNIDASALMVYIFPSHFFVTSPKNTLRT